MHYKTTTKLFRGAYQYKIVLVVPGAGVFRSGDMEHTLTDLKKINLDRPGAIPYHISWRHGIKTQEDLDYCFKLERVISGLTDFEIRVESPFVSIYTNDNAEIDKITAIDPDKVKYICSPPKNTNLIEGTVLLPKITFEFRVTLGKTTQENSAFVNWAESNQKVKLTGSCKRDLLRERSWGGTYFYITGDNNLLLAKMHLGGAINKVERIIKA